MKRITLAQLRKEIWKVLTEQVKVIRIEDQKLTCSARCEYDDTDIIPIWVDDLNVRLDHAVVHEILHKVLDKHFEKWCVYHVYEYFITSLEPVIFNGMTKKEKLRWRKEIRKRIVRTRK